MLLDAALDAIRTFWSSELGVARSFLERPGITFSPDERESEVVVLQIQRSVVVVGPSAALDRLRELSAPSLTNLDEIAHALGPLLDRPLGENTLSFADAGSLRVPRVTGGNPLWEVAPTDSRLVRLREVCAEDEWTEAEMDETFEQMVGYGTDDRLVSVAGYQQWGDAIAHVCVVTAPSMRRQGLAALVGGAAAELAIERGLVAQWRFRPSNRGSAAVAHRLGFVPGGVILAAATQPHRERPVASRSPRSTGNAGSTERATGGGDHGRDSGGACSCADPGLRPQRHVDPR